MNRGVDGCKALASAGMFEPLAELMGVAWGTPSAYMMSGVDDDDGEVGGVAFVLFKTLVSNAMVGSAQLPRAVAERVLAAGVVARGAELMGSARPGQRRIGARLVMHLLTSGMKLRPSLPPQARGS